MPYIFGYTKSGGQLYFSGNADNYPGLVAKNCDVNDSLHLAYSDDGKKFIPLRNDTGILFAQADLRADVVGGITKTLIQPWIFRRKDGGFGVCAVRRNQEAPDDSRKGAIMLFFSEDLIHYEAERFLDTGEAEIANPRCRWDIREKRYRLEWESEGIIYEGYTRDFVEIREKRRLDVGKAAFALCGTFGIEGALPGNVIEITEQEGKKIRAYLGRLFHTGVELPVMKARAGEALLFERLPKARCVYCDGSVHDKKVEWSQEDYRNIDFSKEGAYRIRGKIVRPEYEFPFVDFNISDPYLFLYQGQYYMIYLDLKRETGVLARKSESVEGLKSAKEVRILYGGEEKTSSMGNWWAPELHMISGIPYIFTTVGSSGWNTTKSCVYRCDGDIMNPEDWEGPWLCVKPDGTPIRQDGVSLDMTYFCVNEIHYVMWSDRVWADSVRQMEPEVQDCANIFIASVNPEKPWELTSMPTCIRKPVYGWERYETKVEEGPFLLRRGQELFVTIACSSTALADLYCVGILHSDANKDLLLPESWDWLTYPAVTKESVPGEFGPGHNCFVKDPESGDDLFVYHAVAHDERQRALGRFMGIRRVHWGISGYPYLEMTGDEDLDPSLGEVVLTIEVS